MPRRPDPARKPELLEQILDHLLGVPLATVTLRTLADGIGVSTYALSYHFGSKAQLMTEIVEAIERRQAGLLAPDGAGDEESIEEWIAKFTAAWKATLSPRARQLQRLEFEAAMLEALEGGGAVRRAFAGWQAIAARALEHSGIPKEVAAAESRVMVAVVYGLQFDLLLTGEVDRVDALFDAVVMDFRKRVAESPWVTRPLLDAPDMR
jgi:AcrR family transcriptional regulator